MDITTLQALLNDAAEIVAEAKTEFEEASENVGVSRMMKDIDFNYHLGVEHGINRVVRLLKEAMEEEVNSRDNDAQWIDYVVRSAIENNSFNGYCSFDSAYDEAAEQLDVDHDTLGDAFQRVLEAA
jgi:hypothetical protein